MDAREQHERKRIREGVEDKTLSNREAKALKAQLNHVKSEERDALKFNDGSLTAEKQIQLNNELKKENQNIRLDRAYDEKGN